MSFRFKTILAIAFIESILLIILTISVMNFLNDSNEAQLQQRAESTTVLFAKAVKNAVLSSDLATLESFIEDILKTPDIVYVRISNNNYILAEGGKPQFLPRRSNRYFLKRNVGLSLLPVWKCFWLLFCRSYSAPISPNSYSN